MKSGLIVMGYLPRWKTNMKSVKNVIYLAKWLGYRSSEGMYVRTGLAGTLFMRWWWDINLLRIKVMHHDQHAWIFTWEILVLFFSWSLPFLKSLSLSSKFWWHFCSCLLESHFMILTFGKNLISLYFFVLQPSPQRSLALP